MRLPTPPSMTSSLDEPRRNLCRFVTAMSQAASDHMWANVSYLRGGREGTEAWRGIRTSCDHRQSWGEIQDVQISEYSGLCCVLRAWDWQMSSRH
jgi:hypothetical protein